jgi:hypothetical protein
MSEIDVYIVAALDTHGALYKAVTYIRNQAQSLKLFLTEPAIPIHNNLSERALRIVALLPKNSLFAGHDEAAQRYAQLLSLLTTCRLHDVDSQRWLADVPAALELETRTRKARETASRLARVSVK